MTRQAGLRRGASEGLGLIVEDDRQQRAATVLVDVDYVIEAHFELTEKAGPASPHLRDAG